MGSRGLSRSSGGHTGEDQGISNFIDSGHPRKQERSLACTSRNPKHSHGQSVSRYIVVPRVMPVHAVVRHVQGVPGPASFQGVVPPRGVLRGVSPGGQVAAAPQREGVAGGAGEGLSVAVLLLVRLLPHDRAPTSSRPPVVHRQDLVSGRLGLSRPDHILSGCPEYVGVLQGACHLKQTKEFVSFLFFYYCYYFFKLLLLLFPHFINLHM